MAQIEEMRAKVSQNDNTIQQLMQGVIGGATSLHGLFSSLSISHR